MMGSSPLDLYAREYFTSLNSVAEKISADISNAVAAYEDLWHTLNIRDQHQIINETIIHPDVVVKYTCCPEDYDGEKKVTSCRYYADEGKVVNWHDEHAAPFSWKTLSQQDLSVFSVNERSICVYQDSSDLKISEKGHSIDSSFDHPNIVLGGSSSKLVSNSNSKRSSKDFDTSKNTKSKSVILRIHTSKNDRKKLDQRHNGLATAESDNCNVKHGSVCKTTRSLIKTIPKPKGPPPPPPPKIKPNNQCNLPHNINNSLELKGVQTQPVENEVCTDSSSDININMNVPEKLDGMPKTGFDFLDNW